MHTRVKSAILAAARATPNVEICGFIVRDAAGLPQILPCVNQSPEPDTAFEIDVQDHIRALSSGTELLGVYHSHPGQEASGFSPEDMAYAHELALPLYLCCPSAPGHDPAAWSCYVPPTYEAPLEGRAFCLGFADCWEIPRVYYRQNLSLYLSDYDRDESFCHEEQGTILSNYEREGFARLPAELASVQQHDILMFRTEKALPQHFGVFVGQGGRMLHHRIGRLSEVETITDRWATRLLCVFRHRSLV